MLTVLGASFVFRDESKRHVNPFEFSVFVNLASLRNREYVVAAM